MFVCWEVGISFHQLFKTAARVTQSQSASNSLTYKNTLLCFVVSFTLALYNVTTTTRPNILFGVELKASPFSNIWHYEFGIVQYLSEHNLCLWFGFGMKTRQSIVEVGAQLKLNSNCVVLTCM